MTRLKIDNSRLNIAGISKTIILIVFMILPSCAVHHEYVWNEYPIEPNRIASHINFNEGHEIKLIKGKSDNSRILFGGRGRHQFYGSIQTLTDGIVDQLAKEMQKKRVVIKDTADKSLEITVNRAFYESGFWSPMDSATIEFTAKFGDGRSKSYSVQNATPYVVLTDRTLNGVIAKAVIELMNDIEVERYVNQ